MTSFFQKKVYQLIKKIPKGRLATYGQIGEQLGNRRLARAVGNALHQNSYPDVPCHRVVSQNGHLAFNFGKGGWQEQKRKLLKEGIRFKAEKQVDLAKHRAILNQG